MKKLLFFSLIVFSLQACKKDNTDSVVPDGGDPTDTTFTLAVSTLVTGLDTPWEMTSLPDGRTLVTERPGRIRVISNNALLADPWMDLTSIVEENGESGLMGISADPDFTVNKYVYIAYTYINAGSQFRIRLVRLREDPATQKGVEDKILIDNVSAGSVHDGGAVKFGPDRKLYWTVGDAGQTSTAQNTGSLNGKILRLNSDGSIPDNPIANSYVYSYGHRNPQGLAWQPGTSRLFSTEHGPSGSPTCCRDELNYIEPNKNYGWPTIYGSLTGTGLITPLLHSGDNYTWAPGGMSFINQGKWNGSLVFTGLRGTALYRVVFDPNDNLKVLRLERHLEGQYGRLRDVMVAPNGDLWIATSNQDGRGTPAAGDDKILVLKIQ